MEADTYIKDEAFDLLHEAVLFRFTETGGKASAIHSCHAQAVISHTIQNAQGICNLNYPGLQGDGCFPAVKSCPWYSKTSWGKAAPSPVTPLLGDVLGKKAFSAGKDSFPWEGPAFRNFPPSKRPCDPPCTIAKNISQLAEGTSLHEQRVANYSPPGTQMGNSAQHILHFLSQKDTPSVF